MSLKNRLRLLILGLALALVATLSLLNLYGLASAKFEDLAERATSTTLQVQTLLVQHLNRRAAAIQPASSGPLARREWAELIRRDEELPRLLADMLASSRTIIEIQILDESGEVLASSNPVRAGQPARRVQSLVEWSRQGAWKQLREVLRGGEDFAVVLPVGTGEQPLFRIRVLYSTVLVRSTLEPAISRLITAALISLLAAAALAVLASNLAFRPLARVSEAIDRIAQGEMLDSRRLEKREPEEITALENKLQVLGQQFRGARQDALDLRGNVEQLLERLEEAVLLFDREDHLIMAGRAAENLLGRGRWEMLGRPLGELLPPSTALGAAIASAVGLRHPVRDLPVEIETDGGHTRRVQVNVEFLESYPGRERLGTLVSLRDADTRRQISTQLDVSARLAAISRLTGGVAHEIKNPLNAIALHLEVLRARLEGQDEETEREIDLIASEITRLDRVVKTFLDFTRPVELNFTLFDARDLAAEVTRLVEPEAANKGIHTAVDLASTPLPLRADRDLLKQALLNVVVNAVEAMPSGGRLEIGALPSGSECLFRIADQGPGIPPEIRNKVFQLYFTTKGKGSGIGLAMTFRVVQLHGGTIDFTSEVGQGTTFWIRLPLAGRPPAVQEMQI